MKAGRERLDCAAVMAFPPCLSLLRAVENNETNSIARAGSRLVGPAGRTGRAAATLRQCGRVARRLPQRPGPATWKPASQSGSRMDPRPLALPSRCARRPRPQFPCRPRAAHVQPAGRASRDQVAACLEPLGDTLVRSSRSSSWPAGGASDGYGLGRGAAGPDRRCTTTAAGVLRVVV